MLSDLKRYEYVPPEGGWGYLIMFGMITPIICGIGSVPSFGLVFGDFLNSIGAKGDTVAVITSFFFISFNFAGLLTNVLSKRYSKRSIALSGSCLYILGSFFTVFVTTKLELFISYGLLQGGSGFGLMTPISFDVFNSYFVKRRSFMMSLSSSVMGLCLTLYPILAQFAKNSIGFRGCLVLIAACNMHTFVAMLIMHPFEWHSKRVVVVVNQENLSYMDTKKKLMQANSDEVNTIMESEMVLMPINVDTREDIRNMDDPQGTNKNRAGGLRIVEFLDLNLMKDPIYVNIALGIAFTTYSDSAFISFQPTYLLDRNYSNDEVASVIASGVGADLLSRLVYSLAAAFINLKSRDMYLFGTVFMLLARVAISDDSKYCQSEFAGLIYVLNSGTVSGTQRTYNIQVISQIKGATINPTQLRTNSDYAAACGVLLTAGDVYFVATGSSSPLSLNSCQLYQNWSSLPLAQVAQQLQTYRKNRCYTVQPIEPIGLPVERPVLAAV
ncbi:hypothetical protein HA402_006905 [Bradysia odoriphaga]|nr:hypothetical protein HA402_006905 [Bradysia odoriphaga]